MRILVANHHGALVGGIETYLAAIIPALEAHGHDLQFAFNHKAREGETPIAAPKTRDPGWKPDVVYMHAVHDLAEQAALIASAPTVAFAHGYYGLCISGTKTWQRAPAQPCRKNFDWKCLALFHAKGCGGANPLRMWRDFRKEARQLELYQRCAALLTHGGRMRAEYIAQGLAPERVLALPHFVATSAAELKPWQPAREIRLAYVGRFDPLKGGQILLRALPLLGRPVRLQMIGAGRAAGDWKKLAEEVGGETIRVDFHGWIERARKDALVAECDLLVVPSLWPEPFGQVGLEAGALGVPSVAFDSGGIANWLRDGVNGMLAPANPPTPEGLAAGILKALGNPAQYAKMRANAILAAREFSLERHVRALNEVFASVLQTRK